MNQRIDLGDYMVINLGHQRSISMVKYWNINSKIRKTSNQEMIDTFLDDTCSAITKQIWRIALSSSNTIKSNGCDTE